jgi:DNA (cytosine-5)-methyltransferase 1
VKYLSICSGIEAASVAWHPLGWTPLAFSEIEAFPRAVLQHHYPDVPLHGDFTKLREEPWIGEADLLVGGTPCQAFSIAGLRNSLDDERGNLTLEFVRLADAIDDIRPNGDECIILWENVPGVLSVKDNAFRCFLAALVGDDTPLVPPRGKWSNPGLVAGPKRRAAWRILDAQYFGVPQRRRRVFVVASARDDFDPAEVLFEREDVQRHTAPRREKGEAAPTIPSRSTAGGGGLGTDFDCDGGLRVVPATDDVGCLAADMGQGNQFMESGQYVGYAPPLARCVATREGSSQDYESTTMVATSYSLQGNMLNRNDNAGPLGAGHQEELSYTLTKNDVHAVAFTQNSRDEVRLIGGEGNLVGALAAQPGMKQQNCVAYDLRGREGGAQFEGPHETANIRAASGGSSRSYVAASAVRRLTPRDCERLQGFPDDFTLIPVRGKPAADGPRYKALGNSMAVPVMRWIGKRVQNR